MLEQGQHGPLLQFAGDTCPVKVSPVWGPSLKVDLCSRLHRLYNRAVRVVYVWFEEI